MKTKSKIVVSALLVMALCVSLIAGTTFALFTSESGVDITVKSGKVDVKAEIKNLATSSLDEAQENGAWANGGKASVTGGTVTLDKITPGDSVSFDIVITNNTDINAKYRVSYLVENGYLLASGLDITVGDLFDGTNKYKKYATAWNDELSANVPVTITLPNHTDSKIDNLYMGLSAKISFLVEAVQSNGIADDGKVEYELLPDFTEAKEAHLAGKVVAPVYDNDSLMNAFANSSETNYVVLERDMETTGNAKGIKKDLVLDLNNNTLTTAGIIAIAYKNANGPKGVNITIKNGTINSTGFIGGQGDSSVITFENVTINVSSNSQVVYMSYGDSAIINSGTYGMRNLMRHSNLFNYFVDVEKKILIDVNKIEYQFTEMELVYLPEQHGVAIKGQLQEGVELLNGARINDEGYLLDDNGNIGILNRFLLNLRDKDPSAITIYGGSFKNFNPADNLAENPRVSFVAEGYSVVYQKVDSDWWFTVVADSQVDEMVANGYTLYVQA